MSDLQTIDRLPDDRPPDWANAFMRWAITTPVIEKMIGGSVALLGFTGRRTGAQYQIPVSYHRDGDVVTVITKRVRKWWHNFETPAEVTLRLAGRDHMGTAELVTDPELVLDFMTRFLETRPVDAKAYGLGRDEITRSKIARIIPHIVMIRIALPAQAEAAL